MEGAKSENENAVAVSETPSITMIDTTTPPAVGEVGAKKKKYQRKPKEPPVKKVSTIQEIAQPVESVGQQQQQAAAATVEKDPLGAQPAQVSPVVEESTAAAEEGLRKKQLHWRSHDITKASQKQHTPAILDHTKFAKLN